MTSRGRMPVAEVFLDAGFEEARQLRLAGRDVVVFTHGSPGRTTPSEDAAACFQVSDTTGVLVVADGVGGHQSGEVAAAQAIECMQQQLHQASSHSLRDAVLDGIEAANTAVLNKGLGAATTLALVELQADFVRPYHVGDSMITLISQRGRIKWQSVGHAPVGYAVEAGVLDEEEAMMHPDRHIVSNVVGDDDMSISLGPQLQMAARDTLILCSDGLSDNVSTDEIAAIMRTGPLRQACDDVVRLARSRMHEADDRFDQPGKPDDLTVIACRFAADVSEPSSGQPGDAKGAPPSPQA